MKRKSFIVSGFVTLCIIFCLSVNVIAEIELTDRVVQICNADLGVFCGYAEVVSVDSDSITYEGFNEIKKGNISYSKDVVTWKVKNSKIVDVFTNQTKQGLFCVNNDGIEKIKAASSENMCTIIAKHDKTIFGGAKVVDFRYKAERNDYWTIFSDGRYYIRTEE